MSRGTKQIRIGRVVEYSTALKIGMNEERRPFVSLKSEYLQGFEDGIKAGYRNAFRLLIEYFPELKDMIEWESFLQPRE